MKLFDEIPYLENDFLILRKITKEDSSSIKKITSNETVKKYLPANLFEYQFESKLEAIDNMYRDIFTKKESLFLGIYLKSDPNSLTGILELYKYDENWNKVSIGIRLDKDYWGKKIAKNAIKLMMDYLFEKTDIKRITAHIMSDNESGIKLFDSLGFRMRKYETYEDWGYKDPVLVNKYVYERWGNIKYVKIGDGEKTMVILPGLALQSTLGAAGEIAHHFVFFKDYSIYLFDDRSNIAENYTIRERAGDIAAEMKTLGLKHAYVYGTSMGGMTGQYLAIDHPDLVEKLFITSTYSRPKPEDVEIIGKWHDLAKEGNLEDLVDDTLRHIYSDAAVEQFGDLFKGNLDSITEDDIKKFIILTEAIMKVDTYDELNKIKCPVFIVRALGDKVLSPDDGKILADKLGCELYTYGKEYSHAVCDEAPDHNKLLFNFFEKE